MANITRRIGKGPGSFEMSASTTYMKFGRAEAFLDEAQAFWDRTHDADGNRIEPPKSPKKSRWTRIFSHDPQTP